MMEIVHRDLRILKKFDYVFAILAVVLAAGLLYIGSQTASLPHIERHVDAIVQRLDNHEGRIQRLENWHN